MPTDFTAHPYLGPVNWTALNRMTMDDYRNGGPVVTLGPKDFHRVEAEPRATAQGRVS